MRFDRKAIFGLMLAMVTSCGPQGDFARLASTEVEDELFVLGSSADPLLEPPGPGAGEWASEPPTVENQLLANAAYMYLMSGDASRRYGPEAARAFWHYFSNAGSTLVIDVEKLLREVPSVRRNFDELLAKARDFIARQPDADEFRFASRTALLSRVPPSESRNWYLAMDGHSYYLKAHVVRRPEGSIATFYLYVWDRYDWDPGVVIPVETPLGVVGIDQHWVGEFHRQGLAREFTSKGLYRFTERLDGV